MKHRQMGMSPISVLVIGGLLGFVLLVGFRCVPALNEYFAIQRIIKSVAEEGNNNVSISDLRRSFDRRGQIDDVVSIKGTDLSITKDGGKVVVEVEYARKVPVVANVSLLFDFHATTADQYQ